MDEKCIIQIIWQAQREGQRPASYNFLQIRSFHRYDQVQQAQIRHEKNLKKSVSISGPSLVSRPSLTLIMSSKLGKKCPCPE